MALAAVPTLLAESLRTLLDERAEVTVVTDRSRERFDLAIVTPDGPYVDADLVIILDNHPAARGGGIVRGALVGRVEDLNALIDFVREVGDR